jgi:anthranilate phosphoribosyltransferase
MNNNLVDFGETIDTLISGEDLSRAATREAFTRILEAEQTEMHQGAFLAAITAKGPTPRELAGAWQAIFELDTVKVNTETAQPLLDNCGTGMDGFKTFNISTAAALVAAAGGVPMARHGARGITSGCGTVDLCESLGVDAECRAELVKSSIETSGIGLFNGMSRTVHPQALFRVLSRMQFGSILNIAASLANPVSPEYGVRGVYAKNLVPSVAQTMKEIGFKRALVFHGTSGNCQKGMDELSPVGTNLAAELCSDGSIREFQVFPQDVGVSKDCRLEEIASGDSVGEEALRLARIATGRDRGTLYETVCLNAAPIFYISGAVSSLKQGVDKSRELIASGRVLDSLYQWVGSQNRDPRAGIARLEAVLESV